jgi:hypothetical protein
LHLSHIKMNRLFSNIHFLTLILAIALLTSCAHPNAALGDFRGKYIRAGFMLNDSSLQTEVVLTSRGEVYVMSTGSGKFVEREKLPNLKTKAAMLAVEKSGILSDHKNSKGLFSTFYVEYHKRHKIYKWTWGELNWPDELKDTYKDLEKLNKKTN